MPIHANKYLPAHATPDTKPARLVDEIQQIMFAADKAKRLLANGKIDGALRMLNDITTRSIRSLDTMHLGYQLVFNVPSGKVTAVLIDPPEPPPDLIAMFTPKVVPTPTCLVEYVIETRARLLQRCMALPKEWEARKHCDCPKCKASESIESDKKDENTG